MQKVWLESYPAGVPAEIDLNEFSSVQAVLARTCGKYPNCPAFRNLGATLTFAQVDRLSRAFAAWLQNAAGLRKGSRIAIMMPNLLQYPVVLFGALRAGMIVVNVNPLYTPRELQHQLADSGAEAIVIVENFAHVLGKAIAHTCVKHVVTTQIGDLLPPPRRWLVNLAVKHVKKMVPPWKLDGAVSLRRALRRGAREELDEAQPGHGDTALLQYTGGTTGTSKGAVLSHGNLVANLLQAHEWAKSVLLEGQETVVTALPLYHIFSLTLSCLLPIRLAGVNLLITNPRDMPGFIAELKKSPFSVIMGVNTLFNGLLNTPRFTEVDFSHLKLAMGGGAAVQPAVAERWKAATGKPLLEGYGLTEASPLVTCNRLDVEYTGTIGLPMPSTEVVILDDFDHEVPLGEKGEICVRGPQVMQGYWQRPEETQNAMAPGGWLRTGDVGVMDSRGYIKVTDRKKDMILVSGFNVYPTEIENVIGAIPGVVESAVIGVPDPASGEAVKALVVRSRDDLSAEAVVAYCRQNLTSYKVPKLVEFRSELPKTPIGKVLRRELRSTEIEAKARSAVAQ